MQAYAMESAVTDPHHNLALEERLLTTLEPGSVCLYLWQNRNTVVIGRHQNAWKECRVQQLQAEGGHLARRTSGGGAVYHDLGNLNFSFVVDRAGYDLNRQLSVVLAAVRALGVDAAFSGRNDLTARGSKFSGNAFCFRERTALHHGTLLLHVDLERLTRYLTVSAEKIKSKGIESVRSRVVNLGELAPGITVPAMKQALLESFKAEYGPTRAVCGLDAGPEFDALVARHRSWDWLLGASPAFDVALSRRFPWGGVTLELSVRDGAVTCATCWSDAMDEDFISCLGPALTGAPMRREELCAAAAALPGEAAGDVAAWLGETEF